MQGTQSRRASGSWRRNGQFAALRYVSRHLEIEASANADDVEREPGSRWELLRAVDELSPVKGDAAGDALVGGEACDGEKHGTAGWPRC